MSIANNQRFKAGPTCLLTMPLIISDNENAEFTTAAGAVIAGGKTAGEGHVAVAGDLRTAAVARTGVLRFDGLEGRAAGGNVTAFINIDDGRTYAGYTTYGINATGRQHVKVAGQSNVFDVRVTKAPVTGTRVVRNDHGGNSMVTDYAAGGGVNAELTAERAVRAYYLPWRSNAATTMQLGHAADYFLTSTLTGCTFSVYGTRLMPTVTHANNGAQPSLNMSQDYMTSLLEQIKLDEEDPGNWLRRGNEARLTTHGYKLRAAPYLDSKIDKGYTIDTAKTHTNVIGYRNTLDGRWSFFAQQVVVVGYTRNGAKGFFGKKIKKRIFIKQARQIWPVGGGPINANLWN